MSITLLHNGQSHILEHAPQGKSRTLARVLWLEGPLPPRPLCMGIGQCGLCRVLFHTPPPEVTPAERRIVSPQERERGVRLACRHLACDGMVVEVEGGEENPDASAAEKTDAIPGPKSTSPPADILLAVDLGTTSIAWRAFSPREPNEAWDGGLLNPQMTAGSDVMSRLARAAEPEGRQWLHHRVVDCLRKIVEKLAGEGRQVSLVGLAANPAMTMLAVGRSPAGLEAAPYRLDYEGDRLESLPGLPPLWTAPQLAPFLGGDVVCGLAWLWKKPRPFLLADMGTNGEFVLVTETTLVAASVPLGPALEGIGMRCGGLAGKGAVVGFHPGPEGLRPIYFDAAQHQARSYDAVPPRPRITGTGYLTLIQWLLDMDVIEPSGLFNRTRPPSPRMPALAGIARRLIASLKQDDGPEGSGEWLLPLPDGLVLTAGDVESLLKVKAAFSLAVERLLTTACPQFVHNGRFYLAGALGRHAPLASLERLGFLPPGGAAMAEAVGNSSLEGMASLLAGFPAATVSKAPDALPQAPTLSPDLAACLKRADIVDLAADPHFSQQYMAHMAFGHS